MILELAHSFLHFFFAKKAIFLLPQLGIANLYIHGVLPVFRYNVIRLLSLLPINIIKWLNINPLLICFENIVEAEDDF